MTTETEVEVRLNRDLADIDFDIETKRLEILKLEIDKLTRTAEAEMAEVQPDSENWDAIYAQLEETIAKHDLERTDVDARISATWAEQRKARIRADLRLSKIIRRDDRARRRQ